MTLAPVPVSGVLTERPTSEALNQALIQAVGFDKLSAAMRELALAIASRYGLDPMLKHLVMVEGKPYITRDGLLHVAHRSGVFDGIEVTRPVLEAGYWRTVCTVYRKDFSRPFVYPGRYPASGGNARYAEEMAIKVGEVMCLRRAFDVSAPVIEERWEEEESVAETVASTPTSLVGKVLARAESLTAEPVAVATVEPTPAPAAEEPLRQTETPEPVAPVAPVAPAPEPVAPVETVEASADVEEEDGPTLAQFAQLVADIPQALVKRTAKEMFPSLARFADLTPGQLQSLLDRLVELTDETPPEAMFKAPAGGFSAAASVSAPLSVSAPVANAAGTPMCGAESPLSGARCTLDPDHRGPHRNGTREAW